MDTQKSHFLRNEFLTMSVNGALRRSNTYSKSAKENERKRFRTALRKSLDILSKEYESNISEEVHISNIKSLSDELSSSFPTYLNNSRFRIGIAQKALNLYLKYLWCIDLIPPPPHCPFDSIIINKLSGCSDLNWTSIDDIDDYRRLVEAAKINADGKSLADWELEIWTDSSQFVRVRTNNQGKILNRINAGNTKHVTKATTEKNNVHHLDMMLKQGDIFRGQINDLSKPDKDGWQSRDITFFKRTVNSGMQYNFPAKGNKIVLQDTSDERYELAFTKPESEDRICLGQPGKLKKWYQKKNFDNHIIKPNEKIVYFEYTGIGNEFILLTEDEYNDR